MTAPPFQTWSRFHAVSLLLSGCLAALSGRSLPFIGVAALSTAILLGLARDHYTPSGRFGLANTVTLLRLAGALALPALPPGSVGVAVLTILALDGLDGFLARQSGSCSAFGAHFDMETDAMLVAMCALELFARGGIGGWVLCAGALRYAYVVCLWLWPARAGDAPRSRWGRLAFFTLVVGMAAPWLLGARLGVWFALVGSAAVTLSFARSFYYSYSSV
jgi:phosphatidylglycerophosphate synthase